MSSRLKMPESMVHLRRDEKVECEVLEECSIFLESGTFVDTILVGADGSVVIHRVVLTLCKRFQNALPEATEDAEHCRILLPDYTKKELELLRTILYRGAIIIKAHELRRSLAAVDLIGLDLKSLSASELYTGRPMDMESLITHPPVQSSGFHCFRCGTGLVSREALRGHLEEHVENTKMWAGKLLRLISDQNTHGLRENLARSLRRCLGCGTEISAKPETDLLMATIDHRTTCCESVEKRLDALENIATKPPTCPKCQKTFRLNFELIRHQKKICQKADGKEAADHPGQKHQPKQLSTEPRLQLSVGLPVQQKPCLQVEDERAQLTLQQLMEQQGGHKCCFCHHEIKSESHLHEHIFYHKEMFLLVEEIVPVQEQYCSTCDRTYERKGYLSHRYLSDCGGPGGKVGELLKRFTMADVYRAVAASSQLQQSQDSTGFEKNPEAGNKKRERSGSSEGRSESEPVKKRTIDHRNVDIAIGGYKCGSCRATFCSTEQEMSSPDHFCFEEKDIPLESIEELEQPSQKDTHKLGCILCTGDRRPVLRDNHSLKLHYLYAHCNQYFCRVLEKSNIVKFLPWKCRYCNGETSSWRETLHHVAIYHQKLHRALAAKQHSGIQAVLRRLFPDKYRPRMNNQKAMPVPAAKSPAEQVVVALPSVAAVALVPGGADAGGEPQIYLDVCRDDDDDYEEVENNVAIGAQKEPVSTATAGFIQKSAEERPGSRSFRHRSGDTTNSTDSESALKTRPTKPNKPKRKPHEAEGSHVCEICPPDVPTQYSSLRYLYQHMAIKHFARLIEQDFGRTEGVVQPDGTFRFACEFPECSESYRNRQAKIKHTGEAHSLVLQYLSTPKIRQDAKEAAGNSSWTKNNNSARSYSRSPAPRSSTPGSSSYDGGEDSRGSGRDTPSSELESADPAVRSRRVRRQSSLDSKCSRCGECFASKENLNLHNCNSLFVLAPSMEDPRNRKARPSSFIEQEDLLPLSARRAPTPHPPTSPNGMAPLRGGSSCSGSSEEEAEPEPKIAKRDASLTSQGHPQKAAEAGKSSSDSGIISVDSDTSKQCHLCLEHFKTFRQLQAHRRCSACMRTCVPDLHKHCQRCNNVFDTYHETCPAYQCGQCFSVKTEFRQHLTTHSFQDLK